MRLSWIVSGMGMSAVLSLAGCGGDPANKAGSHEAAGQAGVSACTSDFVLDYNRVGIGLTAVMRPRDLDRAQSLVNDFGTKYQGVVCELALQDPSHLDATPTTINADAKVAEWKSLIAIARGGGNPGSGAAGSAPTPAPGAGREVAIASLVHGITLEVLAAGDFNRFANGGHTHLIQLGRDAAPNPFEAPADICYLEVVRGTASYRTGDRIRFAPRVISQRVEGVSSDGQLIFGCVKLVDRREDWRLRDLDRVFAGVARVVVPAVD